MTQIYVFDAYGTLFDVHSAVRRHTEKLGPNGQRLSEIWRAKQLEYSWVRALMGEYRDFWKLTEDALDYAFEAVEGADSGLRAPLLESYRNLDCYDDVPGVLTSLKNKGAQLAILSNGSPDMLQSAVRSASLDTMIDTVFSTDSIQSFKTVPAAYDLVTDHYGADPSAISFQSSNRWDIAGAASFGFRTIWINRTGMPNEYADYGPDRVLSDLTGLIA